MFDRLFGKIHVRQYVLTSAYVWLETIFLIDDREAERLSDWTVGYYHCKHCDAYRGFAYRLPPKGSGEISPQAHNERNAFWREHAHGDGRILLFEQDIQDAGQGK